MPVSTRQTTQDVMHLVQDPGKIMGDNMARPSTAAMTGDVVKSDRRYVRITYQELSRAWTRL